MTEHNVRIYSWFEILPSYNVKLKCRTRSQNANSDLLSRLPIRAEPIDEPAVGYIADPTEDIVYLTSRNGYRGNYTPLSLIYTPTFGMAGLTITADAAVLGILQPQSFYSVWSGVPANTSGCDYFHATGQRMVVASDVEPSCTDFVLQVQVRE